MPAVQTADIDPLVAVAAEGIVADYALGTSSGSWSREEFSCCAADAVGVVHVVPIGGVFELVPGGYKKTEKNVRC